jgi:hypothetical protein
MATTCRYCLGSIAIFADSVLRETCPFCDRPLNAPEEEDRASKESDFTKVKFASVFVGAIISQGLLRFDWLYILLFIPLGFMLLFAAQEFADWVKHRNDPPGLSLK